MAAPTDLVAAALREFGTDTPTTQSVMRVAVSLAATVNRLPGLRGREKADLVLAALRQALNTSPLKERIPDATRAALLATVDTVVPETLNLVVAAGRGELDFRRPSVGCLAAIAAALCRSAAAVSGDARIAQAAAVVDNLREGKVAEVAAAALPMEEVAARAIGIATEAVEALETTAATVSAIVVESQNPTTDSTAPPTAPPTDEPSST